ncbi:MAG: AGE family epimerase/isomerase [Lachnospiraceae bacterium]|nr:AGE family epimerase/isomerase [Lachnospiraceae bacterium]
MADKYKIGTRENREFLEQTLENLLQFGHRFPSPGGGSYWLGDDGTPWKDRPRETWITSRMTHVYSIGAFLGHKGSEELVDAGLKGLQGELRDRKNGGWYSGITSEGEFLPLKQCYAHAFVILASTSAYLLGRPGAEELMREAADFFLSRFWDEDRGLTFDTWNTEFTELDSYRGINANMHTVEAFLALADAADDEIWRQRAGRIIDHVRGWAEENSWRIPEHFTSEWVPDLECNKDRPADPFKPYGATPGHGIEWARLITQYALSAYPGDQAQIVSEQAAPYIADAEKLYRRAVSDAWNADGAPGIVYTTDWEGQPVVHDRMHWTLAEAINTSAVLYHVTKETDYAEDYAGFLGYLDETVMDHENGSWFHQLDSRNQLLDTVWPGKSDLYHAVQSMLIPKYQADTSIAKAVKNRLFLE